MIDPKPSITMYRTVPTTDELRAGTLAQARANGCTCNPDIEVPTRRERRRGVTNIHIRHDEWCPLLQWIEAQG